MKKIFTTFAIVLSVSAFAQSTITCFNTPDGVDNTWTGGWSYKEYIIPAGFKIDSVYGDFDRPGYPVSEEDFIFSFCAGTTVYDVNIATSPFNYATINTSLYDHWIDLTAFNYSSVGVVRVFLPVHAGAVWNDLCFATSPNTTSINEMNADNTLIYPNPARDFINIKNAKGSYLITDLLGKVVKQIIINSTVQEINIQELNKGIYFLISNEDNSRYKFIKQ